MDYFTQLIRNIIVNNLFNILFYIPIEIKNDRTTNFHKQSIDNQMNFKLNLCKWAYGQSAKTFRSHNLYLYMYVCVCACVCVQTDHYKYQVGLSFRKVINQVLKSLVGLLFHCSLSMIQPGIGLLVKITGIMAIIASRRKVLLADRASLPFWHVPVIKISWL